MNNATSRLMQRGKRAALVDLGKFLVLVALLAWFVARGTEQLGYNWQWYRIPRFLYYFENGSLHAGLLLQGLEVTLRITGAAFVLAFVFGLVTAMFRLSSSFMANVLARFYLETIRNTPLLIQLFFAYFVVGPILGMSGFWASVLALSLFEGAYASEIFRAGIASIDDGQWEAAESLGGGTWFTYREVILPQAVPRIVPPLASQAVSLVKDSALVSTVAVYDLTMQGQSIVSDTFLTFEVWFTVAAIYLVLTLGLSGLISLIDKRLKGDWNHSV
ncbi:amino acid ABC transporter permease [Paucidesulfovibrio longus]|jgi:polar amino acid transport system permease protein|uniref:amino acid ABC transporter permease n=1 Tax=Paucidesulfovibrio longus TaxID=889 RepID=UPI000423A1A7|nr:amino acid ABC transporter permease [Paucidesulfovibrio longus]